MSEWEGGAAEREALDRARLDVAALRCAYFRRLQNITALGELGAAAGTGYRSLEALVADRDNLDRAEAKRLVAEAADLCARSSMQGEALPARLPCTADALAAGLIDPAHVKIIREAMRHLAGLAAPPPPDELAQVEQTLAEKAQQLPPRMLRQLAKAFIDFYDPDGAAPPDEGTADELHLLRRKDGSVVFKGWLGDSLEAEMMVEVFGVLGAPAGPEDRRTIERRHADALKDLLHDARGPRGLATDARPDPDQPDTAPDTAPDVAPDTAPDTAPDGEPDGEAAGEAPLALIPEPRRPEASAATAGRVGAERPGGALITVTIDHRWLCETLKSQGGYGTLDSGHHVDAATIRRWACDAEIVPIVLGSKSEPLDVGRRQRTAPDAIRRALNLRDGGCAFPGCDRQPRRCQAHHVRQWIHGGVTAVDTMCLLCRYHHQLVHHGHWTIEMIDGRPWFTPPWYVDSERQPRLGGRARIPA